jgi:hypothetical protein
MVIMNAKEYMENGVVLDYFLGLLTEIEKIDFEQALNIYPELDRELKLIQNGMDKYMSTYQNTPPDFMKDKIWGTLQNLLLEKEMDLRNLPLLNKFSDHKAWLSAMAPLLPKVLRNKQYIHLLTHTDKVMQVLIMSAIDIEDEVHGDVYESFMILEGECECRIGTDTVVRVKAGGYLEIPLHQHHDVKIISDYVVGVMQRIAA